MNIVAFTGAGISKASGVPTFNDLPEIREKLTRTFATNYPEQYEAVLKTMRQMMSPAQPNDAHYALAEYKCPICTMNIDGLHQKAGSTDVIEMHGNLDSGIVLYGDLAPNYQKALHLIETKSQLYQPVLLIIGSSGYTMITHTVEASAVALGFRVIKINRRAETEVRSVLAELSQDLA